MKAGEYDYIAGCLEGKKDGDEIIFEDEQFYICKRQDVTCYYAKWYEEEDDGVNEYIIRLNDGIVQCGFIQLIDKLLQYKWMYDELCK